MLAAWLPSTHVKTQALWHPPADTGKGLILPDSQAVEINDLQVQWEPCLKKIQWRVVQEDTCRHMIPHTPMQTIYYTTQHYTYTQTTLSYKKEKVSKTLKQWFFFLQINIPGLSMNHIYESNKYQFWLAITNKLWLTSVLFIFWLHVYVRRSAVSTETRRGPWNLWSYS